MAGSDAPAQHASLADDPLLAGVPTHEGYKVLGGVVLYRKLGRGGMGAVYRGRHIRLNVDVAVKVMAPPAEMPAAQVENFVRRFIREAQTAAKIAHQNLVRVIDVNAEAGVNYLVMDFVDGETAAERLRRKGVLAEAEAVEIVLGAADGLAEAHARGIVHRDVKPDNLLIDRSGRVKVADLGLAKAVSSGSGEPDEAPAMPGLTLSQQAMGTPLYMSPEQTRSAKRVGPRADVWSLGATLFQLLTGRAPWLDTDLTDLILKIRRDAAPEAKRIRPELTDGVSAIVDRALRKDASERYADCGEMAGALRRHLEGMESARTVLGLAADEAVPPASEAAEPDADEDAPSPETFTLIAAAVVREREPTPPTAAAPGGPSATMPTAVGPPAGAGRSAADARAGRRSFVAFSLLIALVMAAILFREEVAAYLAGGLPPAPDREDEAVEPDASVPGPVAPEPPDGPAPEAGAPVVVPDDGQAAARLERDAKVEALLVAARTFREKGLLDRARESLTEAIKLAPDRAGALELLAEIEAEIAARRAEEERASTYAKWMKEGLRLAVSARYREAAEAYGRARESAPPGSTEAGDAVEQCLHEHFKAKAVAALDAGDIEGAFRLYQDALDRKEAPEVRRALTDVGEKLRSEKAYEEALVRASRLVEQRAWKGAADVLEGILCRRPRDEPARALLQEVRKHPITLDLGGGVGMDLIYIGPRQFTMGDDNGGDNERPAHPVALTRGYYLGRTEVTRGQFAAFVRATGYRTEAEVRGTAVVWAGSKLAEREGYSWTDPGFAQSDEHPVVCVSCRDAEAFCAWLAGTDRRPYRLPTEAEWEIACRAGAGTAYCWGDGTDAGAGWLNAADLTARKTFPDWKAFDWSDGHVYTAPVARFQANAWGFHDMHGNVWEWCADLYSAGYYSISPQQDPTGPAEGKQRVLRGGSFSDRPGNCRSAVRAPAYPNSRGSTMGFRVAASPIQ